MRLARSLLGAAVTGAATVVLAAAACTSSTTGASNSSGSSAAPAASPTVTHTGKPAIMNVQCLVYSCSLVTSQLPGNAPYVITVIDAQGNSIDGFYQGLEMDHACENYGLTGTTDSEGDINTSFTKISSPATYTVQLTLCPDGKPATYTYKFSPGN